MCARGNGRPAGRPVTRRPARLSWAPAARLVPILPRRARIPCTGAVLLSFLCGCSGSGAVPPPVRPTDPAPRIESAESGGGADALAAGLLLAAAGPTPLADPALARAVEAAALDHLRTAALGAGAGPDLTGSARVRRLAQDPSAPPDRNGNGRNWDETLEAEVVRIAAFAGHAPPQGLRQPLFPWADGTAAPRAPLSPADPAPAPALWRTVRPAAADHVRLADVAGALRARVLAAGRLLRSQRGALLGASGEDGLLGLLLVEQALAAEEELLAALFTDGGPPGPLGDPAAYEPRNGLRWLPAGFAVVLDPQGELPLGFTLRDVASDLDALAALLEAAAELVLLARPDQPVPPLRAVFAQVFPPPPPTNPPPPVLSWQVEIRALVHFRCGGCHLGFPTGGFQVDTLAQVLAGSPRTRALSLPMVVPGDHAASFLHRILTGPPPPFQRMPLGSSLPPAEIATIDRWIDEGAHEEPPAPPPPPVPGEDLAAVCFRNLVAMHFEPASGALHHRHEGDGPSGFATAESTGRALAALARLAEALPGLGYEGRTAADVLALAGPFAARRLLDAEGRALAHLALEPGAVAAEPADLAGQAALVRGLWAAARIAPRGRFDAAAGRATARLLGAFREEGAGFFAAVPDFPFARYTPEVLARLLGALGGAAARDVEGAAAARQALLARLRPVLAHAEWDRDGEVLGDGIADTDGDGVPEPALAAPGGRLPLLAGAVLVGDPAAAAPAQGAVTWTGHVRPLLLAKCGGCHLNGNAQGDYRLDTVRLLRIAGESGGTWRLLMPGDPEGSLLYRKLAERPPPVGAQMPLGSTPLDEAARALVRRWIAEGAPPR